MIMKHTSGSRGWPAGHSQR